MPAATCKTCGFSNPSTHRFCGSCGASLGDSGLSETSADAARGDLPDAHAERRQITILFSDLVGSTQLSTHLDPEDYDTLLRHYHRTSAEVIAQFGGHVAQYLGDGILAYFGYPVASEDDAERAVRSGLALVQKIRQIKARSGTLLSVRVGIATGLGVVGRSDRDRGAFFTGDTPILASRLQSLAAPNSMLIAESTRRLVGSLFEYEPLGASEVKGFANPVPIYRVIRERTGSSRFQAVHAAAPTPLVNRREELALLLGRWAQAKQGDGAAVHLSGEAGIGKSRVVEALFQQIAQENHTLLTFQCSPYASNSALHPVVAQLERMAHIDAEDAPGVKLDKLIALLAGIFDDIVPFVPLFAALLSIPVDARFQAAPADPRQQKDRMLAALLRLLDRITAWQPAVIVVEDAHWGDPTLLDWLKLVVEWIPHKHALLIITSRPDFAPVLAGQPRLTSLSLNRLNRRHSVTMVRELAGAEALSDELVEQIVTRTDGTPLFIEELSRAAVEARAQTAPARGSPQAAEAGRFTIPATLQDLLTARLDQLGGAKVIAQICSAIGREFTRELLFSVAPLPEPEIKAAVDSLVAAGIVLRGDGNGPQRTYMFKHALIQDAAYESILRRRRKELHGSIADALLSRFAAVADARPEVVAHHLSVAGRAAEAVHYWERAGRRSVAQSANVEATRHFKAALEQLESTPNSIDRKTAELGLRIVQGPALINTIGPISTETRDNYTRARQLCNELPETEMHFAVHWGLWRITQNFVEKQRIADDLERLAGRLRDEGLLLQARHTQWATCFHLGRHTDCLRHVTAGLSIYSRGDYSVQATVYGGHDPKVCGCGEAAFSQWLQGRPDEALARSDEALEQARRLKHAGTTAHALDMNLLLQFYRRDPRRVLELAEKILDFATAENFPVHKAKGLVFRGWAIAHLDNPESGLALIRSGLERQQEVGTREDFPIFFDMKAEVLAMVGEPAEAIEVLDAALSETSATGLSYWSAELHRRKGEILARDGLSAEAEQSLRRACEIAHEQGASALELRAAISLARHWAEAGREKEARDLLAPVYGRFSDGHDMVELEEAARLLERKDAPEQRSAPDSTPDPAPDADVEPGPE